MSRNDLWNDVLKEGETAFEQHVFSKTLQTARRRRVTRIASPILVVALLGIFVAVNVRFQNETTIVRRPGTAVELAHTVLRSQPFAGVIRSEPAATLVNVAPASVFVLRTGEFGLNAVNYINDDQLLDFFQGQSVALVHRGPHYAELIFLRDQTGE